MTTKAESKSVMPGLISQWAQRAGVTRGQAEDPSFSDFCTWLEANGYSHYLRFRSVAGPLYDVESWFDHELGQQWRN